MPSFTSSFMVGGGGREAAGCTSSQSWFTSCLLPFLTVKPQKNKSLNLSETYKMRIIYLTGLTVQSKLDSTTHVKSPSRGTDTYEVCDEHYLPFSCYCTYPSSYRYQTTQRPQMGRETSWMPSEPLIHLVLLPC